MKACLSVRFLVKKDTKWCIQCQVCIKPCSFVIHYCDAEDSEVKSLETNCNICHCCIAFCPSQALAISRNSLNNRRHCNWSPDAKEDIGKQAAVSGKLLVLSFGLHDNECHSNNVISNGTHGSTICLRGAVESHQLGRAVVIAELHENDKILFRKLLGEFTSCLGYDIDKILITGMLNSTFAGCSRTIDSTPTKEKLKEDILISSERMARSEAYLKVKKEGSWKIEAG